MTDPGVLEISMHISGSLRLMRRIGSSSPGGGPMIMRSHPARRESSCGSPSAWAAGSLDQTRTPDPGRPGGNDEPSRLRS
jgi:hypothetical protein